MSRFQLSSEFEPKGDQAQAIAKLSKSLLAGNENQTLLGVTGSGKTFTVANLITELGQADADHVAQQDARGAALLASSRASSRTTRLSILSPTSITTSRRPTFRAPTPTLRKDSSINDEIERLRLSSMGSLLTRKDVIVVASVSCIYGLGSPDDYKDMMFPVKVGQDLDRDDFLKDLVSILYERNDIAFGRGKFRVRGDVVEVFPAYLDDEGIRVEFLEMKSIASRFSIRSRETVAINSTMCTFYPAKQFVTPKDKMARAIKISVPS